MHRRQGTLTELSANARQLLDMMPRIIIPSSVPLHLSRSEASEVHWPPDRRQFHPSFPYCSGCNFNYICILLLLTFYICIFVFIYFISLLFYSFIQIYFYLFIQIYYSDAFYLNGSFYAKMSSQYEVYLGFNSVLLSLFLNQTKFLSKELFLLYNTIVSILLFLFYYTHMLYYDEIVNIFVG